MLIEPPKRRVQKNQGPLGTSFSPPPAPKKKKERRIVQHRRDPPLGPPDPGRRALALTSTDGPYPTSGCDSCGVLGFLPFSRVPCRFPLKEYPPPPPEGCPAGPFPLRTPVWPIGLAIAKQTEVAVFIFQGEGQNSSRVLCSSGVNGVPFTSLNLVLLNKMQ